MRTILSAAALIAATLAGSTAWADVTVDMVTDGEPGRIVFGPEHMRMESGAGEEGGDIVLFDGAAMTISMLDSGKRTYQQIDKATLETALEGANTMMDDMMKQMEAHLKDLPPEQRKMIEAQMSKAKQGGMPGGMPGAPGGDNSLAAPAERYVATGKSKKINGYSCQGHKILENGVEAGEVWTASLDEVGLSKGDMAVFGKFQEFSESMPMAQERHEISAFNPMSDQFIGVPILRIDVSGGKRSTTEVKSVKKGKVDAALYTVPSGYEKEDLMGLSR